MAPGTGLIRLTRVALFAGAAVGLASAAHAAGGGAVPWRTALVLVPVVMLLAHRMAGRRRSMPGLLVALGGAEVVLHEVFMAVSGAASCQLMSGAPSGGSLVGGTLMAHPGTAQAQLAMHCGPGAGHVAVSALAMRPSSAMLAAHVAATLLTALVLAHGESAVWALASCLAFAVLVLPRAAIVLPRRSGRVLGHGVVLVLVPTVIRRALRRRGPPLRAWAVP